MCQHYHACRNNPTNCSRMSGDVYTWIFKSVGSIMLLVAPKKCARNIDILVTCCCFGILCLSFACVVPSFSLYMYLIQLFPTTTTANYDDDYQLRQLQQQQQQQDYGDKANTTTRSTLQQIYFRFFIHFRLMCFRLSSIFNFSLCWLPLSLAHFRHRKPKVYAFR